MIMGRPRAFNMDQALDQALHVFWKKGYEGTSIVDLTEAMGINPPSLYAAFGNKETLFKKALDRYETRRDEIFEEAFAVPDGTQSNPTSARRHRRTLERQGRSLGLSHGSGSALRRRGMRQRAERSRRAARSRGSAHSQAPRAREEGRRPTERR